MFRALETGQVFAHICKSGAIGKVHSIFEKAVNIRVENKLVTLLCNDIDIMPSSLVSETPHGAWAKRIKIDENVLLTPDIIFIGNTAIIGDIVNAPMWTPISNEAIAALRPIHHEKIISNCRLVEKYLSENAPPPNENFPTKDISRFNPLDFIGLGLGLTPSGDDFLAGMLFSMHFMEKLTKVKNPSLPTLIHVISNNLQRTGEISQHFLHYALKGAWGRNTENVLLTLIDSDTDTLYRAVKKKLSFGASSGLDELMGCLFGIKEYLANV